MWVVSPITTAFTRSESGQSLSEVDRVGYVKYNKFFQSDQIVQPENSILVSFQTGVIIQYWSHIYTSWELNRFVHGPMHSCVYIPLSVA